jgi:hypothetical protein
MMADSAISFNDNSTVEYVDLNMALTNRLRTLRKRRKQEYKERNVNLY